MAPYLFGVLDFAPDDILDGHGQIVGLEGGPALGEELVEGDATGPQIHFLVVAPAEEHLGCPIVEGARDGEHFLLGAPLHYLLADAEIDEFYFAVGPVVQDVFGLDVPVAHILRVDVLQGADQLEGDVPDLLLRQIREFQQVGVTVVVHHQVAGLLPVVHVHHMIPDNVGMLQGLYVLEVCLQEHYVLLVHRYLLNRK